MVMGGFPVSHLAHSLPFLSVPVTKGTREENNQIEFHTGKGPSE